MLKYGLSVAAFLFLTHSTTVYAKEIPVQGRLFAGVFSVDPTDTNTALEAQGLQKIDNITRLGVEITYPLHRYLDVGMRYTKRLGYAEENPANSSLDHGVRVDQDSVLLLARIPLLKEDIVHVDIFAGVGGSNTSVFLKTASQDGEFSRRASGDWFATPFAAFGSSVAVGYKKFYLVFEAGFESNRVDNFNKPDSMTSDIGALDLSGSYFSIGLMFDGVPGTVN